MKESNYKYEVIVALNPKTESKDKEKTIKLIEDKVTSMAFSINNRENLGNKELAYKIKGLEKGDFWVFTIGGDKPIKSAEFKLFLNRDLQVIRYLILKI
ncbi:MAG: 30S ribosomal protein S6 [Candidatus Shapirobacteria bacterium GW2011_GWE1_38_10]|uniref:Small ribosomal subunit protein bS6 n=1 Tax=Candidatus Shapirobacteria bacterium GW2011_GWE1_38_10 TaxID=1618488 RepID=A0A0G0I532_9BACT|nr:MAG: 30S ribosomal protein S6 [Candidatus Shapirobacteria bacterium GW2011_GWF2_37_20]KKQ50448.1 MAG: 30S ribosomal protein S6 [Candidatus Shapirobacteria bacterium GW2011_GWE1_38_10]KKQ65104.1 MAG: 30S ribosomal protein S6 [Candidatus Shapirobacteria bacterium GW2011_GWF1_38_23]HBP50861.1 30S ribosomal protein S6 [Candidatus Shapirobacteria bacterium]